jgi:DNA-binding NarL/FixJ family response regulator
MVAFGIPEDDDTALACVRLGASGLVAAGDPLLELVTAVKAALRGELHCSRRLAAILMREVARSPNANAGFRCARLTPREGEIADLLERGVSNKTIARHLGIEVTTVKTHVHHVLAKLRTGQGEGGAGLRGARARSRTLSHVGV